jgi:hypothetical protein
MSRWVIVILIGIALATGGVIGVVIAAGQHQRVIPGSRIQFPPSTGHEALLTLGWSALVAGVIAVLVGVVAHQTRNAPPRA